MRWSDSDDPSKVRGLKNIVKLAALNMADELHLPRSQATTTIKPSGTLGKIMDTTEGLHKPLGRYLINTVKFSRHDPIVSACMDAGYRTMPDPGDVSAVLVQFPVSWPDVEFDTVERDGRILHVNLESAVTQLERYKFWMQNWVDHNASVTISYDPSEVPAIIEWIDANWDLYVGVSFLFRTDPTMTAEQLGFQYLPQSVITKEEYEEYTAQLKPLVMSSSSEEIMDADCATGACPMR